MNSVAGEDPLIEVVPIVPIYCEGIGPICIKDGMVHVTLWAEQQRLDGEGMERVVVGRISARFESAQVSLAQIAKVMAVPMARSAIFGIPVKARRDGH